MDWSAAIDAYCERTSPDFWAEPFNALSNLAFLIAAAMAARHVARAAPRDAAAWLLVLLVAVIGTGSFLFHTFATRWAALADVLPITIFINVYLYLALRRFLRTAIWLAALATVAFFVASAAVDAVSPPDLLNGSVGYLPALAAMLVVGGLLRLKGDGAGAALLVAAAIFVVSLTARTLDASVCASLPVGLHYLWHVLNALVLFRLTRALVEHGGRHA